MPGKERKAPKTWHGYLKKHRRRIRPVEYVYKGWIARLYREKGPGTPFTAEEMMTGCKKDFNNKQDYFGAMRFLMNERKLFMGVMGRFFNSEDYERHKKEGKSDKEIFRGLIENATRLNIYPVWSDSADKFRYKLFDMPSFIELTRMRGRRLVTEIEHRSKLLSLAFDKLPEFESLYESARPRLTADGAFIALPDVITCSKCNQTFTNQDAFVEHYNREHLTR